MRTAVYWIGTIVIAVVLFVVIGGFVLHTLEQSFQPSALHVQITHGGRQLGRSVTCPPWFARKHLCHGW